MNKRKHVSTLGQRKPRQEVNSLAARAFHDAMRDIIDDQGWFELLVDGEPDHLPLAWDGRGRHPAIA